MKIVESASSVKSVIGSKHKPDNKKRAAEVVKRLRLMEGGASEERLAALYEAVIELASMI